MAVTIKEIKKYIRDARKKGVKEEYLIGNVQANFNMSEHDAKQLVGNPKLRIKKGKMEYSEWEDQVTSKLEIDLDVTRSDAQGLVEAHSFEMQQSWTKGLTVPETAKLIAEKSVHNSRTGSVNLFPLVVVAALVVAIPLLGLDVIANSNGTKG